MDVIIDTNIIRRDLKLNDRNFEILLDYLSNTNSKLILPSIVVEEIIGLYSRTLKERQDEFERAQKKLKSTVIKIDIADPPEINFDQEANNYLDFIHDKLNTSEANIIEYKNEFLPELVQRAIQRKKPLGEKGQQFRDGLLWLTLLDYAESTQEKRIAFISDNPKDFAEKGENSLNLELKEEADLKGVEIKYFKTLADFAKEHASVIDFITQEWLNDNLDYNVIEDLFDEIPERIDEDVIVDGLDLDSNEQATGYANRTDYINSNLIDFYVYEKADGTILLNAEFEFETEYEIEIERTIERDSSRYDYKYSINPLTGEPEMRTEFIPDFSVEHEQDFKHAYPLFRGKYVITIIDKKITDYELKDWGWG